jgi:hypothetical protein
MTEHMRDALPARETNAGTNNLNMTHTSQSALRASITTGGCVMRVTIKRFAGIMNRQVDPVES